MPKGRTPDYAVWRACERFSIRPPSVNESWEENTSWVKTMLMAYSQIRNVEEASEQYQFLSDLFKALKAVK